jgi:hypothetical protein
VRVVVAIDPAASTGEDADETGIIVAGKDKDSRGYVLADLSGHHTPIEWARIAVAAYKSHGPWPCRRRAYCARRVIARRYPLLSNAPTVEVRFARDSLLEGDGFELPVPREKARYPIGAQLILLWLQPRV